MVTDKYKSTHADQIKHMKDQLEEEVAVQTALKGLRRGGSSTEQSGDHPRTSASPEWAGEFPWNFRKRMPVTGISVADFDSGNSSLVCIKVYVFVGKLDPQNPIHKIFWG